MNVMDLALYNLAPHNKETMRPINIKNLLPLMMEWWGKDATLGILERLDLSLLPTDSAQFVLEKIDELRGGK